MKNKHLDLFLVLFILSIFVEIQAQPMEFAHLDNSDGLSNNQIEYIIKDSHGFMWFATDAGLNRYDGKHFKIFRHYPNNKESMPLSRVTRIYEDYQGNLWLTDATNFCIFNYESETFTTNTDSVFASLNLPPNPTRIIIDTQANFLLHYADSGLYKFNPRTKDLSVYHQTNLSTTLSKGIPINIQTTEGYIWVLFQSGLLERINEASGLVDFRDAYFTTAKPVSTIQKLLFIDNDNEPWIYPGAGDKDVAYYSFEAKHWVFFNESKNVLSSNFVRKVTQDHNNAIWIATDHGGINIYNKRTGKITVIKHEADRPTSICQNSIISLYCDNSGIMWVGSYKNGISYHHPNLFKFRPVPLNNLLGPNFNSYDCNRLLKDSQDNLWIGTNGQGLIKYNEKTNKAQLYTHNAYQSGSISSDIITSICEDHTQTLWIGTFLGGLNALGSNSQSFKKHTTDNGNTNSLSNKSVYEIIEDANHNLWLATLGGGIDKLNVSRTNFEHFNQVNTPTLYSDYIVSMYLANNNQLFVCTSSGVNTINTKTNQVDAYFNKGRFPKYKFTTRINSMMEDSRNLIWTATEYGIDIYNLNSEQIIHLTAKDGLPSDEIVSLIEDNNKNMWAGTHNGLIFIECIYKGSQLTPIITRFDTNDGLPSNTFNINATHKDSYGNIYLGTTKGYIKINPNKLFYNRTAPTPRFTELLIANKPVKAHEKINNTVILSSTICDSKSIDLPYDQTNIAIHLSAMSYLHPNKNRFRYQLKGLEENWTEITNGNNTISYSNLNSGHYKLIVYASNDDNVWSKEPITLDINVHPPFWSTWWAYVIYFIILIIFITLITKFQLRRQKKVFDQDKIIMEAQKLHEVDQMKFRFFTNVSHEFKTPLTLILSPLEKLLGEPQTEVQHEMLTMMYRNAQNLLELVNDILDFRKLDLQKMTLNVSQGDVVSFTKDITQSFSDLASSKSIKLTFSTYIDSLTMEFDQNKLQRILSNLLSNAIKYSNPNNKVDVSLSIFETLTDENGKRLCIKVSDTGVGIEPNEINKIFDRFYRIERPNNNESGTGVGLHIVSEFVKLHGGEITVESTPKKGSTFTVYLPIRNTNQISLQEKKATQTNHSDSTQENEHDTQLPLLLIADDNSDFRDFIKGLFSDSYQVITAADGNEAFKRTLEFVPNLILSDVMMPEMDGYAFCRKIRSDIRTSHIPVILLTAKNSEENRYEGIEAGADDYIAKPFNIEMLSLKIAKIVEKQKKLQQSFKNKITISTTDIEITSMDEKFVKKAVSIVEQNISNTEFLVSDLSQEMNMSRVYFYKKILALTNKTPSEFIRFIRLKRAAELLGKSQLFVNEIAFQVGFNDPKYFRKYFKEEFGMSPNDYKKHHAE